MADVYVEENEDNKEKELRKKKVKKTIQFELKFYKFFMKFP